MFGLLTKRMHHKCLLQTIFNLFIFLNHHHNAIMVVAWLTSNNFDGHRKKRKKIKDTIERKQESFSRSIVVMSGNCLDTILDLFDVNQTKLTSHHSNHLIK